MRLKDIAAALGRRWWLVLIGLLASSGMVYAVFQYFPATYEITSRVLLLPPKSTVLETGNPYLQLGGLREAVDTLGVTLTDQATLLDMKAISEDATVDVRADPNGSAPIVLISIQDHSPEAARLIRDRLLSLVDSRLDGLQRGIGVPASNRVTSTIVSSDGEAVEVGHDQLRAAVAVGAGGVALTLILAIILDAAVLRRRERRRLRPGPKASAGTVEDEGDFTEPPEVHAISDPEELLPELDDGTSEPSGEAAEPDPAAAAESEPAVAPGLTAVAEEQPVPESVS